MRRMLLTFAVLLAGCASPAPSLSWYKAGANSDDYYRDAYDCNRESRTTATAGGSGLLGIALIASAQTQAQNVAQANFNLCMQARGWRSSADRAQPQTKSQFNEIPEGGYSGNRNLIGDDLVKSLGLGGAKNGPQTPTPR